MSNYKVILSSEFKRDIFKLSKHLEHSKIKFVTKKIYSDIKNLQYMPRIHRKVVYYKDTSGEYRRIISGKYIIIYKIKNNEIIILRIFSQKQNYLNPKKFILKEKSQKYKILI